MVAPLLALAGTFAFSGGSPADFVNAVVKETDRPVAYLISYPGPVRAARVPYQDPDQLRERLGQQYRLAKIQGDAFGLATADWPGYMLLPSTTDDTLKGYGAAAPGRAVRKSGRWFIEAAPREVMSVGMLARMPLRRPLKTHWFFERARFVLAANGASEVDVLAAVAAALGADLKVGDAYELTFNPSRFRERAVARCDLFASSGEFFRYQYAFGAHVYRGLTDEQLLKLYEDPENQLTLEVPPNSALAEAVKVKFEAHLKLLAESEGGGAQALALYDEKLDRSKPAQIVVDTHGRTLVQLAAKEKNTYFQF